VIPRRRLFAAGFAALAAASLWAGLESRDAARAAMVRAWTLEAEELGAFARSALARGGDLMVVERFASLARRDDFAYALVMDARGKARIHSDVSQSGRVYESDFAKRALAAASTLVQPVPGTGLVEVDVPLGAPGVLRAGFSFRCAAQAEEWLWVALAAAMAGLAGAVLLALRGADKL
jgi:hypothetical protein